MPHGLVKLSVFVGGASSHSSKSVAMLDTILRVRTSAYPSRINAHTAIGSPMISEASVTPCRCRWPSQFLRSADVARCSSDIRVPQHQQCQRCDCDREEECKHHRLRLCGSQARPLVTVVHHEYRCRACSHGMWHGLMMNSAQLRSGKEGPRVTA
jgi:hypothetical protein